MIVTIHQPDFMPWYGLFQKISRADIWLVLDHIENNPRDAAFWGRRVKILNNGQEQWFSITLNRPQKGIVGIPISDMTQNLSDPKSLRKSIMTIQQAYAKAPFFKDYFYLVEQYFNHESDNLLSRNMQFMTEVMSLLNIDTKMVYSSSLGVTSGSTVLLVELLEKVGATTYLCGNGADGYQKDELFSEAKIHLMRNVVLHPSYSQIRSDKFVGGLSILDGLFHVGAEKLTKLMQP